MSKRRLWLLCLALVALLLALVFGALACAEEETTTTTATTQPTVTFKLGHVTQVTHPYHISIKKWVDDVAAATNGRIKFDILPAAQLGTDKAQLEALIAGTQDAGGISLSTFSNYAPVLDAFQLPFLVNDYDLEQKMLQDPITRQMLDKLEAVGLKGIVIYEGGIRDFLNKKGPVTKPEDIKGMKARAVPAVLLTAIMKAIGTNPVTLAYGQVYNGLQTGLVDGTEMNPSSVYSEKFYEVAKYLTDMNIFPFPVVIVMNKAKWDTIPKADQDLMIKLAEDNIPYSIQVNKDLEAKVIPEMEAKGLMVNKIEDLKPFEDLTTGIYTEWEAKDPLIKPFVDKVNELKAAAAGTTTTTAEGTTTTS